MLNRIWLLRQLHGVVLLGALLTLFFFARHLGFDAVARMTRYCLYGWPVFVVAIAWWDRHWVWKNRERVLSWSVKKGKS